MESAKIIGALTRLVRDVWAMTHGAGDAQLVNADARAQLQPISQHLPGPRAADWLRAIEEHLQRLNVNINRKAYENFERIEKRCEESINEREQRNANDTIYAEVLITYGRLLSERGQTERALKSFVGAQKTLDPLKEKLKRRYLDVFYFGAQLYNKNKKYDAQADQWFNEYERLNDLWEKQIGSQYGEGLESLISYYYNRGDLDKAEALTRKAMVVEEKYHGTQSPEYKMLKVLLAGLLEKRGKNNESEAIVKTISKDDHQ